MLQVPADGGGIQQINDVGFRDWQTVRSISIIEDGQPESLAFEDQRLSFPLFCLRSERSCVRYVQAVQHANGPLDPTPAAISTVVISGDDHVESKVFERHEQLVGCAELRISF